MLSGFKSFNFEEGSPYVSVTKNGVTFNKSVIMKLGYPEYVCLLINSDAKQIAVQVATRDTENSTKFCTAEKRQGKVLSIRWNGRDLLNTIKEFTGWNLGIDSYRAEGKFLPDDHAMLFDLSMATLIQ